MKLQGKVAIVTGAATGIGKAIATGNGCGRSCGRHRLCRRA